MIWPGLAKDCSRPVYWPCGSVVTCLVSPVFWFWMLTVVEGFRVVSWTFVVPAWPVHTHAWVMLVVKSALGVAVRLVRTRRVVRIMMVDG